MRKDLGDLTRVHCCWLLQLDEELATGSALTNARISVLIIPVERFITVVVLDRRTIVVNVEALAHQSEGEHPYLETAIVVEDRAGDFGDAYYSYFQSLRARARPLKREDFSPADWEAAKEAAKKKAEKKTQKETQKETQEKAQEKA